MSWYSFRPYVSVAERRRKALVQIAKMQKKGTTASPVVIDGRTIARSFWGKAWCDNLESYMDYENRLPRGRTYVRNGSVVHLDVKAGEINALVSGSELYKVKIGLKPAAKAKWTCLCRDCAGSIGSLVELLQGRFSDHVMSVITRKDTGLFPSPKEITMSCSCPDWASMCKHIAAVLYGVGARLDEKPELLFLLRSVNHEELITRAASVTELSSKPATAGPELSESEAAAVFGIEIDSAPAPAAPPQPVPAAAPSSKRKPSLVKPAKTPPPKRASRVTAATRATMVKAVRKAALQRWKKARPSKGARVSGD